MNILFIIISSVLYALSFPKLNFWWFAFIAVAPFFYALDNTDSGFKNLLYGVLWGVGHGVGMGYWVFFTVLHHYEIPFAKSVLFFTLCVVFPVVCIFSVFAVCYRFMHRYHLFFYALVVPSLWVLAEYVKHVFPFLIPWGGISCSLVPFEAFIQIADITGESGVMFLTVAVNGLFLYAVHRLGITQKDRVRNDLLPAKKYSSVIRSPLMPVALIVLILLVPSLYGVFKLKKIRAQTALASNAGEQMDAVLVQGNFSTKERWSGMGFYQRLIQYLEMSGATFSEGAKKTANETSHDRNKRSDSIPRRIVVWPETTLNSSSKVNDQLFVEIMRSIEKNTVLISGGLNTDPLTNRVFNSAYVISGSGRLLRYDKHILLPYAETSPLIDLLDQYYHAPNEFAPGQTSIAIDAPGGIVGISICFEILYPDYIRRAVNEGAVYLVNISNDSWFGDSPMPYIHLNAARLRAIENRRFLLRTSNSGISAVIEPTGKIAAQSELFTKARVNESFVKLGALSFYSRHGDWIIPGSFGVLLIGLAGWVMRDE